MPCLPSSSVTSRSHFWSIWNVIGSVLGFVLLIAAGQLLLPPPSVGANSAASNKDAERLARFEKQVKQLLSLSKIPRIVSNHH